MNHQITEISKNLKAMAKDFNCPIICLSQLNRSVEQRQNKRPMMSDIRDSGSVEQDADVMIFLFREKYYDRALTDPTLELIITKNRNGAIGTANTMYNESTGVIQDGDGQRIIRRMRFKMIIHSRHIPFIIYSAKVSFHRKIRIRSWIM